MKGDGENPSAVKPGSLREKIKTLFLILFSNVLLAYFVLPGGVPRPSPQSPPVKKNYVRIQIPLILYFPTEASSWTEKKVGLYTKNGKLQVSGAYCYPPSDKNSPSSMVDLPSRSISRIISLLPDFPLLAFPEGETRPLKNNEDEFYEITL